MIGVKVSDLITGGLQPDFFENTPENHHLHKALDSIKTKYGADKIGRATGIEFWNQRPDVNPFDKE